MPCLLSLVRATPASPSACEQPEERVVARCLGDFQFEQLAGIATEEVRHFGPPREVPRSVKLVADAWLRSPEQDNVAAGYPAFGLCCPIGATASTVAGTRTDGQCTAVAPFGGYFSTR